MSVREREKKMHRDLTMGAAQSVAHSKGLSNEELTKQFAEDLVATAADRSPEKIKKRIEMLLPVERLRQVKFLAKNEGASEGVAAAITLLADELINVKQALLDVIEDIGSNNALEREALTKLIAALDRDATLKTAEKELKTL